ncbi:probable disease resistance protein RXW24L [Morus notabilis]|uniref:probable disease resistance protein RXW24L n=1 Tax=Morus notabilis TaxID=981085 RepID=UPI000CECFB13|nr:probable disease resistance protein RXW24L [Morus notabilis]
MAEVIALVTPVMEVLLQLLMKEANSFKRLHREVKSLKDELECVQCFLKDAEERSEKEDMRDGVKVWLKQAFRFKLEGHCPQELETLSLEIVRKCQETTLYRHWIAEGFIEEKRDKTLEQVAEEYLNELILRNLVQVQGLLGGDGSDRLCQVHDLIRDIILSRADELNFYQIVDGKMSIVRGKCHCISIYNYENDCMKVLDLMNTAVRELPIEINKLHNLRHIYGFYYKHTIGFCFEEFQGLRMHDGIGCLRELQTLEYLEVSNDRTGIITELEGLRQLRTLGILKFPAELGAALCASIVKMNHLERLVFMSNSGDEILYLQAISSPPLSLRLLCFVGRLSKISNWILKLSNLHVLAFAFSSLSDDPLKRLQSLPSLEYLSLYKAYDVGNSH